jgi:hypothetical protein
MGGLAPTAEDVIHIKTGDITPAGGSALKKESEVDIKEAGDRERKAVILGLKVRKTQTVAAFTLEGESMTGYADGGVAATFAEVFKDSTEPGEEWKGFAIPADKLPEQGSNKLKKKFNTTLTLDPVTVVKPNFQIVPVVVAFTKADLQDGHYWMGFSLIRQP